MFSRIMDELFGKAAVLEKADDRKQIALLLEAIGDDCTKVYCNLKINKVIEDTL
jgi:hypothetical protein